tara:strand:- start:4353 stop:5243 length:891 start_codon:yes stop_codon:yes gene_type:complete
MGIFIYETEGEFPDNFIIKGIDVIPTAYGEPAEVGENTNIDVMTKILDLNYEEYSRGLIHSHCGMATSFSGTDTNQLQKSASKLPYYLSVVVNNRLEITAKVAIKSTEEYTGFSFFKNLKNKLIKTPKTFTQDSYEVIELKVEITLPEYINRLIPNVKTMQSYSSAPATNWNQSNTNQYPGMQKTSKLYNGSLILENPSHQTYKSYQNLQLQAQEQFEIEFESQTIKNALNKYAKVGNTLLNANIVASTICKDSLNLGFGAEEYIQFLMDYDFGSDEYDEALVEALSNKMGIVWEE